MLRVSIVGVTGYVGAELVRLLGRRPDVELIEVVGRSAAGQPLGSIFPSLSPLNLTVQAELQAVREADFVFLALPHHASAETAAMILETSPATKVIDMSADFRLRDLATYEKWYGPHPAPAWLPQAVYGLPEINRDQLTPDVRLIANPGCYPTCATLALAPALAGGLIEPDVIISAMSGVSGAGRSLKQNLHFSEMTASANAYGLDGHRHQPEIAQLLSQIKGEPVSTVFVPHLVPLSRGMLATCYARLTPDFRAAYPDQPTAQAELHRRYEQFYANDPFVIVVDAPPATKQVQGSNYCFVYPTIEAETGRLISIAVLDNLVKGAAGEGVQCMNILAGLAETTGLDGLPVYP